MQRKTRLRRYAVGLGLAALSLGRADAADPEGYRLVVHAGNPASSLARKEVADIFLGRTVRWPHDVKTLPVDQSAASEVRAAFTRGVHRRSVDALLNYWQQVIFSGRGVPPLSKSSDREVLEFVAANPGAIGYVSPASPVAGGVKVLAVSD